MGARWLVALTATAVLFGAACIGGGGGEPSATSPEDSASAVETPQIATGTPVVPEPTEAATVVPRATRTQAPVVSPTPPSSPPLESVAGVPVTVFERGPDVPVGDLAVLVARGCLQCDVPPDTLDRLYSGPDSEVRLEPVYKNNPEAGIHFYEMGPEPGRITITLCVQGGCARLAEATEDAAISVIESTDSGITWTEVASLDTPGRFISLPGGSHVFSRFRDPFTAGGGADDTDWTTDYYTWPGLELIHSLAPNEPWPVFLAEREFVVISPDGRSLLDQDKETYFSLDDERFRIEWISRLGGDDEIMLALEEVDAGDDATWGYRAIVDGGDLRSVVAQNGSYALGRLQRYRGITSDGLLFGADYEGPDSFPIVFDFESGLYHRLQGPFPGMVGPGGPQPPHRNFAEAVTVGPFARVIALGDTCLNVRVEPSEQAGVLGCYVQGVLLALRGEEVQAEGRTWLAVRTPAGVAGWAAAEFLEY